MKKAIWNHHIINLLLLTAIIQSCYFNTDTNNGYLINAEIAGINGKIIDKNIEPDIIIEKLNEILPTTQ